MFQGAHRAAPSEQAGERESERGCVGCSSVGVSSDNAQRAPGESRAGTQVGDANGIPANRMIDPKLGTRCQDSGLPHKERYCSNQPPVEASARHAQHRRLPPSFAPECGRVQEFPARCAACTRCRFGVRACTGAIRQRFSGRPWWTRSRSLGRDRLLFQGDTHVPLASLHPVPYRRQ